MSRKYDWDGWFRKGQFTIRRGVDYHVSQSSMYQSVRNNASLRGILVKIVDGNDNLVVTVVGVNKRGIQRANRATITPQH